MIEFELSELTSLLMQNKTEFGRPLVDMPGLDLEVAIHRLNMDSKAKVTV